MTTVCPPNVASKTFLVCVATQTSHTNLASLPHFAVTRPKIINPLQSHAPTSLSCVKNSRTKMKKSSKTSSDDLGCQLIGTISTQLLKTAVVALVNAPSYVTWPAVRRTHKKPQLCGTLISKLRWHKPNSKIANVQVHTTMWLSHVATVKATLSLIQHGQFCWRHASLSSHILTTIVTNHFSARRFVHRCTESKFPSSHTHLHKLIRALASP